VLRHQNYILVGYHLVTVSLNVTSSTYSRIQRSKAATSNAHQWDSDSLPSISYPQIHIINSSHNIVLPLPTTSSKYPFSVSFMSYPNIKLYKSHVFSLSGNHNCSLWTTSFFLRPNRSTSQSTQVTNSCQ